MKVGYIRVSTVEQNTIRQEVLMKELGVERVYIDKSSGGTRANRPQLEAMLEYVREGDEVVVSEISRFARNTKDLLDLVEALTKKGVEFTSKKENIDTKSATGKFMLTVFGAVAELERSYIIARQQEGIECAKERGVYIGRPVEAYDRELFESLYKRWRKGEIKGMDCVRQLGMTNTKFYRLVRQKEKAEGTYVRTDPIKRRVVVEEDKE